MQIKKSGNPIIAGIVTYNPDIERLNQNITAVNLQVDNIVIVDNHSSNVNEIRSIVHNFNNIFLISNDSNLGIAKALNQICQYAESKGAEWVLTLDQDSVVSECLIGEYLKYIDIPKVGMLTCIIKDRHAEGYEAKASKDEYTEVERCFTSGCFTLIKAWKDVGGFDEKMFIDFVDYDMCLSIREKGYSILRINYEGLLHELGYSKDVSFLGRRWVVSNHSAFRKYYIVRNRLYYIKKHSNSLNVWLERRHLLGFITLTIFKEENKIENCKAMFKGWIDSRTM